MKRFRLSTLIVAGLGLSATLVAQQPGAPAPGVAPQPVVPAQQKPAATETGPAAKLVLSDSEWDFGTKWSGEPAEHDVTIRNEGEGPLKFGYRSSCGCTVAQPGAAQRIQEGEFQYQLAAGASDKIKVTYDTKKNRPDVLQTITITTNDPQQPKIEYRVKGQVKRLLELQPERFNFINLTRDDKSEQTIEIKSNWEKPVALKLKPLPPDSPFDLKLVEVEAGKSFKLVCSTKPPMKIGANSVSAILETDLANYPEYTIPALAYIAPKISVRPEVLYVSPKITKEHERVIKITYKSDQPLKIKGVKASVPSIKTEVMPDQKAADGKPEGPLATKDIKVTMPAGDQIPEAGATITIEIDDPDPSYQKMEVKVMRTKTPELPPGAPSVTPPAAPGQPAAPAPTPGAAKPADAKPGEAKPAEKKP